MDPRRYKSLVNFLRITYSTSVEAMNVDAMTLNDERVSNVEYILVDPSCSGSGKNIRAWKLVGCV